MDDEVKYKDIMDWKQFLVSLLVLGAIILIAGLLMETVSAANDYYVDGTNGNNANPGTFSQPWKTIQKAASTLVAGQTVYIRSGVYNEQINVVNSGAPGNWITYSNYKQEKVFIDGTGIYHVGGLIQFTGKHYLKFTGFTVRNSVKYGFNIQGSADVSNIIISNCEIHNCTMSSIIFYPSDGFWADNIIVENNTIHDCQNGWYSAPYNECLSIANTKNSIVRYNYLYDNHRISIDIKDYINNVRVYGNLINATPTRPVMNDDTPYRWANSGIYTDAYDNDEYYVYVYNNVVWGNSTGFIMGTEQGGNLNDVHMFNNLYNGTGHAFQINNHWQYVGGIPGLNHRKTNCSIMSNTVAPSASMCFQLTDKTDSFLNQNFTVRNNVFCSYATGINIGSGQCDMTVMNVDHNLFNCPYTAYYGQNPVLGDPGFTSGFRLSPTSNCIDTGSFYAAPSFDFDGKTRPIGLGIDIGAFEYGSNPTPGFELLTFLITLGASIIIMRKRK